MIKHTPVDVIKVDRYCDHCGGMMRVSGEVLDDENGRVDKHGHRCEKCGDRQYFKQVYPVIIYQERTEEKYEESKDE